MFYYIPHPFVTMREQPSIESKVDSQAIFGEKVTLLERIGEWLFITTPDGYSGWVPSTGVIQKEELYPAHLGVSRLQAHVYGISDVEYGPLLTLPFEAKLRLVNSDDPRWNKVQLVDGREAYIQKGDVVEEASISRRDQLVDFSKKFLGLPYTWGGRSSFGYDCSGFVQMLYKRLGVQLPRNARQQVISDLLKPIEFERISAGDLIFFGTSEYQIGHVGMYLGGNSFIHTSTKENMPYLRISSLSDFEWSGGGTAYYRFRVARTIAV